ncbi:hypothetical protein BMS3Bbin02_01228 [bacterium BMS3Bbin02]|nr:hypothetical protein BMS3Bbin02_01228 [bacterium BMS3Bbin02]
MTKTNSTGIIVIDANPSIGSIHTNTMPTNVNIARLAMVIGAMAKINRT